MKLGYPFMCLYAWIIFLLCYDHHN